MSRIKILLSVFPALFAMTVGVQAQNNTVSTDPVGFVCTDLPAMGFTYLGVSLTNAPTLTSANTTLSGNTVSVGVDLTALSGNTSYAMEINDGTYEGFAADIDSWAGQTITLTEDIEAGGVLPGNMTNPGFDGSRVTIRELPTIASVFGATNSAGLKPGALTSADRIYLFNSETFSKIFYTLGGGFGVTEGWKDEDGFDAGSTPIHFGDGLVIETKDTVAKKIAISGSVKLGPTNLPLYQGFNLVSNPSPITDSHTLADSGIKVGLQWGSAATGDLLYIPSSGGGFDRYHYTLAGGFGVTEGWKNAETGADSDAILLPNAGSFFILRRSGQSSVMVAEDLPNR